MLKVICFRCATVFESTNTEVHICPGCSNEMKFQDYEFIINYSRDAIEFGYHYRLVYEEQYKEKGDIHVHYFLDTPSECWIFVISAILSGVIGNASYDLIKKVIKKIASSYNPQSKEIIELLKMTENDKEYQTMIRYIQDFHKDLEGLPIEIKDAIMQEMLIHNTQRKMEEVIAQRGRDIHGNVFKDQIDLMVHYAQNPSEIEFGQKPHKEHFKNMWSGIDK